MADNSPRGYFKNKKRYVQVGHLGRGGMAVVSESKDEYFQRNIAFKQLKPGSNLEKRTVEFVREAMIMGKLEHPGILPVHDLIENSEETAAMTMDKVVGLSLAEKIIRTREDPLSWPLFDRIRTFQKLVEIVAYSHSRHIVHRDIKPANVMLGEKGDVILLDWGLAKVSLAKESKLSKTWDAKILDSSQSVSGSIKGTPYYMSPESAQGKSDLVKEYSDVFSLGVVLFEFITLSYLIEGTKAIEVLKNAADGKYKSFNHEALERDKKCDVKKLPIELSYIMDKSLKKDYAERYKDASELNADLLCLLNEQPIAACGGSFSVYQIKKFFGKHAMSLILIGLPLLGIAFMGRKLGENKLDKDTDFQVIKNEVESEKSKLLKVKKNLDEKKRNYEDLSQKNIKTSDEISKYESDKLVLIKKIAELKLELENLISDAEIDELQGVNIVELESDIAVLEQQKKNIDKNRNKETEMALHQAFIANTVPFGLELKKARLQYESGQRLMALETLNAEYLKVDRLAVDWMRHYFESSVKLNESEDNMRKGKIKHASEVLSWEKNEEKEQLSLKKISTSYPYKNWTKILKDKELNAAFADDGTAMHIVGSKYLPLESHIACPSEIRMTSEGELFGHYGDARYFYMKNLNAKPILLYGTAKPKNLELNNGWLLASVEKNPVLALRVEGPSVEWKTVAGVKDNFIEKNSMNVGQMAAGISSQETFPPGYRLFNNSLKDGPWLIVYINVLKSRFRNHIPGKGSKDIVWSVSEFDPLSCHDDASLGWLMLGKDGRLFSFRPDQAARQLFPEDKKIVRLFALKSCNLAISQSSDNMLYVYYLNTGQYLFSPGVCPSTVEEIMLDSQNRLLFHLASGSWVRQDKN